MDQRNFDDIFGAYLLGDSLEELERDFLDLSGMEGNEISELDAEARKRVLFDRLDTHYKQKVRETGVDFFGSGRSGSVNWHSVDATRPAVFLKYLKAVARKGLVDRGVDCKTADYFIEAELGNLSHYFEVKQRFQEREKCDLAGVMEERINILYDIFRGENFQKRIQSHGIAVERARQKQEDAAVQRIRSNVDAVIVAAAELTGQAGERAGRRDYVSERGRASELWGGIQAGYRSSVGALSGKGRKRVDRGGVKSQVAEPSGSTDTGNTGYVKGMLTWLGKRCESSLDSLNSDYRSVMSGLRKRVFGRREMMKSAATQDTGPAERVERPKRPYVTEAAELIRTGYRSAFSAVDGLMEGRQKRREGRKAEKAARPSEPGKEPAYRLWPVYRWASDPSYRAQRRAERAAAGEAEETRRAGKEAEKAAERTGRPEVREEGKEPFYERKGTRYAVLSIAGLMLLLTGGALLYREHKTSKSAERSQQPAAVKYQAARQSQAAAEGEAPQPQVTPRIRPTESALPSSIRWEWERDPFSWSVLPMAKNSVRKGTDGNYRVETRVRVLEGNLIKFAQDDGVDYIGIKVGGSKKWLYFKPGEDVYIQLNESQMKKLRDGGLPYQIAGLSPNGENKCTVKGSYRAEMFEEVPGTAQGNGGSASSSMKSGGSGEYAFMQTGGGPRLLGKYGRYFELQVGSYNLSTDRFAAGYDGPMAVLYGDHVPLRKAA